MIEVTSPLNAATLPSLFCSCSSSFVLSLSVWCCVVGNRSQHRVHFLFELNILFFFFFRNCCPSICPEWHFLLPLLKIITQNETLWGTLPTTFPRHIPVAPDGSAETLFLFRPDAMDDYSDMDPDMYRGASPDREEEEFRFGNVEEPPEDDFVVNDDFEPPQHEPPSPDRRQELLIVDEEPTPPERRSRRNLQLALRNLVGGLNEGGESENDSEDVQPVATSSSVRKRRR